VVGIDLLKARLLLGALDRWGGEARRRGDVLAAMLDGAGEDRALVVPLRAFAVWADAHRAALRVVIDVLASGEAAGRPASRLGITSWHVPFDDAYGDPGPAIAAADSAVGAEQSGDRDLLGELLDRWAANPVFAGAVLGQLGVEAITAAVARLADLLGSATDAERRAQERVVVGLGGVVAAVRRADPTVVTFEAIRHAWTGRPPGELALLFLGATVFDAEFLEDAVEQLVLAPTRVRPDDGVWVAPAAVDGEDDRRDSTVLVLQALARNPQGSTKVLIDADLDCLLGEVWYRDGGAALGDVLRVGTDPTRSASAPQAALDVITWVAGRTRLDLHGSFRSGPTLAPLAADALGLVAAPYIGSFRSDRNDGIDVDPASDLLTDALSGDEALRYLMAASQRQVAQDDLGLAALRWAATAIERRAGEGGAVGHLTVVADVARSVAWAAREGDIGRGKTLDQLRSDERVQWGFVQSVVGVFVDRIDPSSFVVSAGSTKVIDHFLPESSHRFEAANDAVWTLPRQQLQLEQIVLAALWRHRNENHLFERVAPPPSWLFADDRVTLVPEMTAPQLEQYRAWLAGLAASGITQIDRVGAEFGHDGYQPPG
jgi:hypothetical protein